MGSPDSEPGHFDDESKTDEIRHTVTVSDFYMGRYPVTQKQYEAIMGDNPSYFKGANLPVEKVTWYDAAEFCNRLSEREGLEQVYAITNITRYGHEILYETVTADWTKNGYRLPTEAEWEYACRAGTTTPFNTGNNITTDQANYDGEHPYNNGPKGECGKTTVPADSFAPNVWGLYDMHGNVYEWCWDWYGKYYAQAQTNPKGLDDGNDRVYRGGAYNSSGQRLRSAYRGRFVPYYRSSVIGFRVVRR